MIKKITYIIYIFFYFINYIFNKITKKDFLILFKEFIENSSYTKIKILNKNIKFFTPNHVTKWRINTFFSKEPETLEWINNFKKKNKIIFWDIGSNIGIYSVYAALKHKNIEIISFEPSTSNLRVLSRNISINKLEKKIKICQIPVGNNKNKFLTMKESTFLEGSALHAFGRNYNYEGKRFLSNNNYKIYGTTINYLINQKILDIPDYVKIDVDGIEHEILEGANLYLKNLKIKSLLIELNKDFKKQFNSAIKILYKNNFKLKYQINSSSSSIKKDKFSNTFNFIFKR
jgi:FkbM family methyltransferase